MNNQDAIDQDIKRLCQNERTLIFMLLEEMRGAGGVSAETSQRTIHVQGQDMVVEARVPSPDTFEFALHTTDGLATYSIRQHKEITVSWANAQNAGIKTHVTLKNDLEGYRELRELRIILTGYQYSI